jgi:hypothetical protein
MQPLKGDLWMFPRFHLCLLSALLAAGALFAGCSSNATPKSDRAQVQELNGNKNTLPLRPGDMGEFEDELFRLLTIRTPAAQRQFRVLDTKNASTGTYVLYSLPNNDGLAFAGRRADGRIVIHQAHWPFVVRDPQHDLVVVRAIPPNNDVNPGYGVVAGRVYNPFIEHIEVNYRDGRKDRVDVTHNRGFIFVRKAFDTRFVQVRGYSMNGNPYWSLDSR